VAYFLNKWVDSLCKPRSNWVCCFVARLIVFLLVLFVPIFIFIASILITIMTRG